MKKINKKVRKRVFTLIFLFIFFVSSQFLVFSSPVSATIQEEDISVEWGDNVYQNLPYWYSGTFYDDADFTFDWTTAKIQFEYIPDNTITYEHSITDLNNSETQYPTNSSFQMVNGTHHQNGTLNVVDDDYHIFNSTYEGVIAEKPDDFAIGKGNSTYDGNLEIIDGNYTTFYSEESEHYPATYSFTDDTNGEDPIDWVVDETGGIINVISSLANHKKVVDLYDNSGASSVSMYNDFSSQSSGTVEFWTRFSSAARNHYCFLNDVGTNVFYLKWDQGGSVYNYDGAYQLVGTYLANTWYHIRITFDSVAETGDIYIDNVDKGTYNYRNSGNINRVQFQTHGTDTGYHFYIDAVGYSWNYSSDTQYEAIGDNTYWINYKENMVGNNLEEDDVGDLDAEIGFIDSTTAVGTATCISDFNEHKKVVKIKLIDGASDNIDSLLDSATKNGWVEFWMKTNDITGEQYVYLRDDVVGTIIYFGFLASQFKVYTGGAWRQATGSPVPVNDQWYHIYIQWYDEATDTFDLYIDNVQYEDGTNCASNMVNGIDRFRATQKNAGDYLYLDAVDYSTTSGSERGNNRNIEDPLDLEIEVNMNLNSFSNLNETYLVYAYRTDISQICNYSIYNFDSSSYDIIENDINLAFVNSYFLLNSSYYNATNDLILSFEMSNDDTEFEMWLERLLVRKPSYLNFSTSVNFDTLTKLLQMDINSYQRSNISQLINMSIWNYTTSSWEYLDGASYTSTFQLLQWINTDFSNYIDSNGDVLLMYSGINIMDAFRFELDALSFKIWRKTVVRHQKTLNLLGTWKYRFILDNGLGTQHIVDWVYFNVIEQQPNFEGISESRYSTRWVLTSTATSGEKYIVYEDQLTSGYWDLSDASSKYFDKYYPYYNNYLSDNSTFLSFDYTGTHFDVGAIDGNPRGILWYNSHFWITGDNGDEVYKYTSAGVYTGTHFGIHIDSWGITWDGSHFWITQIYDGRVYQYTSAGVATGTSFMSQDATPTGITWDGSHFWIIGDANNRIYKYTGAGVYTGFSFAAPCIWGRGLAWDGSHFWVSGDVSDEVYQYTSAGVYTGYHFDTGAQSTNPYGITWDGANLWNVAGYTGEDEVYKYVKKVRTYKNYFTTADEGHAYMQSDTTETLGLISPQFSSKSLSEGDVFVVDLQTTSDNALIKLYLGGALQQTLNLLIGNTKTEQQEVEVLVSGDVLFDQVKIISELTDTEYFKLFNIKAEHWVFEDEEDQRSMYVNPYGQNDLIANLGNNSLKIYENDILRTDIYVTISYDLLTHIFESPIPETIFVSFYDSNNEYLDFNKFTTYVNYTLYEENYINQRLTSREFYVDEESTIYFNVYDSFDVNIYSASRLAKTFIDITLNIYTLKIKNEALDDASYILTKGSVSKDGILFPDDIDEYQIASGNYTFSYIKGSDSEVSVSFDLTQNRLLKINRSRMCYLTYSNQRGEHLFFDNYKTYINGSLLYENIFYRDIGDIVGIEIKDRYDISIKNETYTVISGDNYIPITLTMYSLKIMNQQEIFNWINITRDPNYYESSMYWSEWIAPNEIIEFTLFAGYYKINLTDNEGGGSSYYSYTLNGDDVLLISSGNTISNLIINIANVNTTIGNQITNVQIDLTNQNSNINNTIINIDINLSNVNSSLGTLLTNINLDIININNNISNLYTFTENNFLNLGNNINNSFISIENNIIAINQTISTLVIGLDGKITIVNATITTMFTEMNSQFVVVQSTLDFSFAFLNQTVMQIGNNITNNQIALNNLIVQRANDIDNNIIQIQTLINLLNSTVANESLVVQTLVNIIGNNITENHVAINNLISLLGNNITENNINMINLIELVGNNITTNHFVIQTLIDYVSNNITYNHLELLTNINFINNTMDQNQIELINRLLFINNSINQMALDLTNQIIFVNDTIYSAVLSVSTSIDFNSDCILGNISLTYQQNDFLTQLYKKTMFSQLLNWSDVAFNYSLMEDRIDVWEFINLYKDDAGTVFLRYNNLIDNLTVSAQNTIEQYLPKEDVEYRIWSTKDQKYLDEWQPLPENRTVDFGFFEADVPIDPEEYIEDYMVIFVVFTVLMIAFVVVVLFVRKARSIGETPSKKNLLKEDKVYKKSNAFNNQMDLRTRRPVDELPRGRIVNKSNKKNRY